MAFIILFTLVSTVSAPTVLNENYLVKSSKLPNVVPKSNIKLSETPECADDIRHICPASLLDNNFAVLDCLQNDKREEDANLTPQCHHLIWNFKRNLILDNQFVTAAKHMCHKFLETKTECVPLEGVQGHFLSCLLEFVEDANEPGCRSFLKKMEAIIFSDYRLIYRLTEECQTDIEKFQCGYLDAYSEEPRLQGETIECLSKQIGNLTVLCRHHILRIAELQGDDYHLDRPLFFACREDRERFCGNVEAGEGRVYHCLMRHKMEKDMSQECQEKLFQRERLVVYEYRVDRNLAKACRDAIIIYHCSDKISYRREIKLSHILLCLENALHKGYPIDGKCQAEMLMHRQTLMENYQLIPELAAACEKDVLKFCGRRVQLGGKTLHCLMEHAKPSRGDGGSINDSCRRELELLLKISDVGEDWRVDPVVQDACQSVVDAVCSHEKPGEGRIMNCLMKNFESQDMSDYCKAVLLEIQYFIARDFKLDPVLYKRCHKDALKYCHAKSEWYDKSSQMDPERGPIVLPCLHRYTYHPDKNVQLSRACSYEVHRVMRQRAVSVDLLPEVEEPCISDLGSFCNYNVEKGEEMDCLQRNLEELSLECQNAVSNFTEEESEHIELNSPLFFSCSSILHKYCNDLLAKDVDQGDLIQCLIQHKSQPVMKIYSKCKTSLEHFQLISLKNYRFSYKFKEACEKDVPHLCEYQKTKPDVIDCLSGIITNDTVFEKNQRVSLKCRQQLKFELLERNENILLDPVLSFACSNDQIKFCANVRSEEAQVLECLKDHQKLLSPICCQTVFNREMEEMIDNSVDYVLVSTCKTMIEKYCVGESMSQILECLKDRRDDYGMDLTCRKIVIKRMIRQHSDFRLNTRLRQACIKDISKFCFTVIAEHKESEEFKGKVIECLKHHYLKQYQLSLFCKNQVVKLMRDAAQDYNLNPQLVHACSEEVRQKCIDDTNVEECLKIKFQKKEIEKADCQREIASMILEGKADLQSDPYFYNLCVNDIMHYCKGIPSGHGRYLSCLLMILEENTVPLSEDCSAMLSKRVEMFKYAAQIIPPSSVMINSSRRTEQKFEFVSLILIILLGIF